MTEVEQSHPHLQALHLALCVQPPTKTLPAKHLKVFGSSGRCECTALLRPPCLHHVCRSEGTCDKHPLLLLCVHHSDHGIMNVTKASTRTACTVWTGFLLFTIWIIFPFPKASVCLKMRNTLIFNAQLPGIAG